MKRLSTEKIQKMQKIISSRNENRNVKENNFVTMENQDIYSLRKFLKMNYVGEGSD